MDTPRTKYRHTRALLKLATDDGLTQGEIARLCRVSQPIVSGWANGKGLAFTHQVAELVRRYGHRLNRGSYRLYEVVEVPPNGGDVAEGRGLAKLLFGGDLSVPPGAGALQRAAWALAGPGRLVRVEGAVVFRTTIEHLGGVLDVKRGGAMVAHGRWVPLERWVVHRAAEGMLRVAAQHPRLLEQAAWVRLRDSPWRQYHQDEPYPLARRVHTADDAGAWVTTLHGPLSVEGLLAWSDAALEALGEPHARATVPFLLRKALLEHGYPVDGVEVIA